VRRTGSRDDYQALLLGEVLIFGLLGAALALFLATPSLRTAYELPQLRLVIATAITLAAGFVAILAGARFAAERRRLDLLLSCGFSVACASTLAFEIAPVLDGDPIGRREAWAGVAGRLVAAGLVAAAPLVRGRVAKRKRALGSMVALGLTSLWVAWAVSDWLGPWLPPLVPGEDADPPGMLIVSLALQALLNLVALVGFGWRYRTLGHDLDRWLSLGATFLLFAALHFVFAPLVSSSYVTQGDFLRLLGYVVLLVGVWHAIRAAESGRAIADERARVAREIHDGLAQYLFAVSTHATMLENGAPLETAVPQLKEAASAAQLEARFAVLALSSAGGTAPFDAALTRYVELLTADGALEVELEIDPETQLAPDEQIEVFRIVQEGLGNVRKHAGARTAWVEIRRQGADRIVTVRDDGEGFDGEERPAGQGLKNMAARAATIGGAFAVRSRPGAGTALEVTLRA
jgi:signal transduction histidine kinase